MHYELRCSLFGGAEMTRSDMQPADQALLVATLTTFSDVVRQECASIGLMPGHNPFSRPLTFLSIVTSNSIHLVVDDIPVGGMPDHTYLDRRKDPQNITLDAVIGSSVREFGFRNPIGVTLPISAFTDDESNRRTILRPLGAQLREQLAERALVMQLRIPAGYEHFVRFMPTFLRDHPNIEKNVFLIMRFRSGSQYNEIHKAIVDGLAPHGLHVIRADDKDYTGDLWENVCLHMLGSRFGIAVFEEIDQREFNPNVALELGFMLAQNKRCLLLKDQRMPRMPTDIIGKLYKEFDTYDITNSINAAISRWVRDLGM